MRLPGARSRWSRLLWIVAASRAFGSAVGMAPPQQPPPARGRRGTTTATTTTTATAPRKPTTSSSSSASPAVSSIEDWQRVQEIRKNRHARRGPRLEEAADFAPLTAPPGFAVDPEDFERQRQQLQRQRRGGARRQSPWLSLPRRPKGGNSSSSRIVAAARRNDNVVVEGDGREAPRDGDDVGADQTRKRPTAAVRASGSGIEIPFELTLRALRAFRDEHSHLAMPRRYLVPESASYPPEWRGLDLAGTVYTMRWWQGHVRDRPDRVGELNRIGFVWQRLQPEWNLVLESLIVYRSLHGNVLVPSTFAVPYGDDRWPESCWGIALGSSVYKIRNRGDHLGGRNPSAWSRRSQLDALGFVWDADEARFSRFRAALEWFGRLEQRRDRNHHSGGALMVPSRFVVPQSDADAWPEDLRGYRLGERCAQVRQKELYVKNRPDRIRILADLGFHVSGGSNGNLRWLEVVHAAAVYSQMHGNRLDVPTGFVVPAPPRASSSDGRKSRVVGSDDAWPWPEYLWGFPLGRRLRDVRVKGYYLKGKSGGARRRQLDALGFNWEPKRGRPPAMTKTATTKTKC
mmetsp:Transcript_26212/g.61598  ORF Transcript_26212/g.61598 Transcript_26212/m.61598 type:complete len:573 (-) Transcript_26212:894-2612(-)